MTKLEIAYLRAYAQGAERVMNFNGTIPGEPMGFEPGDVFTMPTEFNVLEEAVEGIRNQFIFITTQYGDVRKLYPSQLSRRVRAYNMDGIPFAVVIANGTASQLYKSFPSVQDGMNALRGKTIKVSEVTKVNTMLGGEFTNKTIYTFDLVD